jgi:hypothetical protein
MKNINNRIEQIDKLWIASQTNNAPHDLRFVKEDGTKREYQNISTKNKFRLSPNHLSDACKTRVSNEGYETAEYLAFRDACLGKEAPMNPNELSYVQRTRFYGEKNGLSNYLFANNAHKLGKEAMKKWPTYAPQITPGPLNA